MGEVKELKAEEKDLLNNFFDKILDDSKYVGRDKISNNVTIEYSEKDNNIFLKNVSECLEILLKYNNDMNLGLEKYDKCDVKYGKESCFKVIADLYELIINEIHNIKIFNEKNIEIFKKILVQLNNCKDELKDELKIYKEELGARKDGMKSCELYENINKDGSDIAGEFEKFVSEVKEKEKKEKAANEERNSIIEELKVFNSKFKIAEIKDIKDIKEISEIESEIKKIIKERLEEFNNKCSDGGEYNGIEVEAISEKDEEYRKFIEYETALDEQKKQLLKEDVKEKDKELKEIIDSKVEVLKKLSEKTIVMEKKGGEEANEETVNEVIKKIKKIEEEIEKEIEKKYDEYEKAFNAAKSGGVNDYVGKEVEKKDVFVVENNKDYNEILNKLKEKVKKEILSEGERIEKEIKGLKIKEDKTINNILEDKDVKIEEREKKSGKIKEKIKKEELTRGELNSISEKLSNLINNKYNEYKEKINKDGLYFGFVDEEELEEVNNFTEETTLLLDGLNGVINELEEEQNKDKEIETAKKFFDNLKENNQNLNSIIGDGDNKIKDFNGVKKHIESLLSSDIKNVDKAVEGLENLYKIIKEDLRTKDGILKENRDTVTKLIEDFNKYINNGNSLKEKLGDNKYKEEIKDKIKHLDKLRELSEIRCNVDKLGSKKNELMKKINTKDVNNIKIEEGTKIEEEDRELINKLIEHNKKVKEFKKNNEEGIIKEFGIELDDGVVIMIVDGIGENGLKKMEELIKEKLKGTEYNDKSLEELAEEEREEIIEEMKNIVKTNIFLNIEEIERVIIKIEELEKRIENFNNKFENNGEYKEVDVAKKIDTEKNQTYKKMKEYKDEKLKEQKQMVKQKEEMLKKQLEDIEKNLKTKIDEYIKFSEEANKNFEIKKDKNGSISVETEQKVRGKINEAKKLIEEVEKLENKYKEACKEAKKSGIEGTDKDFNKKIREIKDKKYQEAVERVETEIEKAETELKEFKNKLNNKVKEVEKELEKIIEDEFKKLEGLNKKVIVLEEEVKGEDKESKITLNEAVKQRNNIISKIENEYKEYENAFNKAKEAGIEGYNKKENEAKELDKIIKETRAQYDQVLKEVDGKIEKAQKQQTVEDLKKRLKEFGSKAEDLKKRAENIINISMGENEEKNKENKGKIEKYNKEIKEYNEAVDKYNKEVKEYNRKVEDDAEKQNEIEEIKILDEKQEKIIDLKLQIFEKEEELLTIVSGGDVDKGNKVIINKRIEKLKDCNNSIIKGLEDNIDEKRLQQLLNEIGIKLGNTKKLVNFYDDLFSNDGAEDKKDVKGGNLPVKRKLFELASKEVEAREENMGKGVGTDNKEFEFSKSLEEQKELVIQCEKNTENKKKIEKENKELEKENKELEKENKELKEKKEKLEKENKELKEKKGKLEKENKELKEKKEKLEKENKELEEVNKKIEQNDEELGKITGQLLEKSININKNKNQIEKNTKLWEQNKGNINKINEAKKTIEAVEKESEEILGKIASQDEVKEIDKLKELKEKLEKNNNEVEKIIKDNSQEQEKIEKIKEERANIEKDINEYAEKINIEGIEILSMEAVEGKIKEIKDIETRIVEFNNNLRDVNDIEKIGAKDKNNYQKILNYKEKLNKRKKELEKQNKNPKRELEEAENKLKKLIKQKTDELEEISEKIKVIEVTKVTKDNLKEIKIKINELDKELGQMEEENKKKINKEYEVYKKAFDKAKGSKVGEIGEKYKELDKFEGYEDYKKTLSNVEQNIKKIEDKIKEVENNDPEKGGNEKKITEGNVDDIVNELVGKVNNIGDDDKNKKNKVIEIIYKFFNDRDLLENESGKIVESRREEIKIVYIELGKIRENNNYRGILKNGWGVRETKGLLYSYIKGVVTGNIVSIKDNEGQIEMRDKNNNIIGNDGKQPLQPPKDLKPTFTKQPPQITVETLNGNKLDEFLMEKIEEIKKYEGVILSSKFTSKKKGYIDNFGSKEESFIQILQRIIKDSKEEISPETAKALNELLKNENIKVRKNILNKDTETIGKFLESNVKGITKYIENLIKKEKSNDEEENEEKKKQQEEEQRRKEEEERKKQEEEQRRKEEERKKQENQQNQNSNQPNHSQSPNQLQQTNRSLQNRGVSRKSESQKQQATKQIGNRLNNKILPIMIMTQLFGRNRDGSMNPMMMFLLPKLLNGNNEEMGMDSTMMMLLFSMIGNNNNNMNMMMGIMPIIMNCVMNNKNNKENEKSVNTKQKNENLKNESVQIDEAGKEIGEVSNSVSNGVTVGA